jgi:HAD superfamily hydrolase (TIGR01484 family)
MPVAAIRYRAVLLDIDGTILGRGKPEPTQRDSEAMAAAVAAGLEVHLNSGRNISGTLRVQTPLGLVGEAFCYNGAVVHDPVAGKDLRHVRVADEATRACLDLAEAHDMAVFTFHDDQILTHDHPITSHGPLASRLRSAGVEAVRRRDELPSTGITKLWLVTRENLEDEVRARTAGMQCRWVTPRLHRIFPDAPAGGLLMSATGATGMKREALEWLSAARGIPLSEMIMVGDDANDVEALEAAGLAVVVQDAHPRALATADRLIAPPEEQGVAGFLEALSRGVLAGFPAPPTSP